MKKCCILCGSADVRVENEISTLDLRHVYRVSGIDIDRDVADIDKIALNRCDRCDVMYFDPANPGSQEFYEQFQDRDWCYPDEKDEFELAGKLIKETDSVLEFFL